MNIAVIGAGNVGCTIAYTLLLKNSASHIILVDINKERCAGEVLDLSDVLSFSMTASIAQGDFAQARDADIIIISAGYPQKPEEPRLNLYKKNAAIIRDIMHQLAPLKKNTVIIMVTNPVDLMTHVAQQACDLPYQQIIGSGTWLDTQRLRRYIGNELTIHPSSIDISIIGEHGDSQCVLWSQASCNGIPLADFGISETTLQKFAAQSKQDVYTIIEKKCATYYGVASCVAHMCEIIIYDKKEVIPVSTYVKEFDICLSIPVVLGACGAERIPLKLTAQETECLKKSAEQLQSVAKD